MRLWYHSHPRAVGAPPLPISQGGSPGQVATRTAKCSSERTSEKHLAAVFLFLAVLLQGRQRCKERILAFVGRVSTRTIKCLSENASERHLIVFTLLAFEITIGQRCFASLPFSIPPHPSRKKRVSPAGMPPTHLSYRIYIFRRSSSKSGWHAPHDSLAGRAPRLEVKCISGPRASDTPYFQILLFPLLQMQEQETCFACLPVLSCI